MAQLSDDCFAFAGPLLPIDEVERILRERVKPVAETETVPLRLAHGRVIARDVVAPIDLPPFDNSAVDGYAVRAADLAPDGETRLAIAGRVTAGGAAPALGPGQAIRIFTGAPMPQGADTVFMQEDVRREGESVLVPAGLALGANRRLAGEDARAGAVVLPQGRRLSPPDVALAAAVGLTGLPVRRRIRVAILSTGDEIVEPGRARGGAALFDANRYLLEGLLARIGAAASDLGILPDDPARLVAAISAAAAENDLVLTSGGVSTGEADHVRAAVEQIGRLVFWRVAVKPGRPVAMGVIREHDPEKWTPVFGKDHAPPIKGERDDDSKKRHLARAGAAFVGLPGNPVAVFVTFIRVVRPLIACLAGETQTPLVPLPVRATFPYRKRKARREYVRVALRRGADGAIEAVKHPQDGAGVITSLTETDGLVELLEDTTRIEPGDSVGFLSYAALSM
jgi:molybdopterin molybdotransferase